MAKATILSVEQTEKAGLFTIIFEGEAMSEFDNFYSKFINDAEQKQRSLSNPYPDRLDDDRAWLH